jgi:predicted ATPase/DNA-binding CsgD family transcriptional regulator
VVVTVPTPLTRFVGREAELALVAGLVTESRQVTLTGPGGAGKTRLALRLAELVGQDFPDGVWFVDFSPLSGVQFAWDQVAMTLGVAEPGPSRTLADAVSHQLAARRALIVLDNCEHVVAAAAEIAARLLTAAPAVKILATSREPLAVAGEVTWAVPPLTEPDGVKLFTDRAHLARPQLQLRDADAEAVRSICHRLDGLPLAIELAAARTRALAPARIAAHLQDHFRILPSGPRSAPGRQATLRASFEWSYSLLSDTERALLRQLSVFAGGFDVEAALAVCPAASIELLAALADRSLIVLDDRGEQAEPRYRMLETIREYAAEQLAEGGEVNLVRTGHRDHYLALAETAEPALSSLGQGRWLSRLTSEHDNLRAALAWSRDRGEAEALARMVVALAWFWVIPHRYTEFHMWLDAAAERAKDLSPRLRARIRNFQCLAIAFGPTGSFGDVPALAGEALAMARTSGDKREEAIALLNLGLVAGITGGAEAMRPYIEEALPLVGSTAYSPVVAASRGFFAVFRWFQSDPEEPQRMAEEAVAITAATGDRHNLVFAMSVGGGTALIQGRLADAAQLFGRVVAEGRQADNFGVWNGHLGLAWVAMFRGDFAGARACVAESRVAAQRSEAETGSVHAVEPIARWLLGWMELAGGDAAQAQQSLASVVEVSRSSMYYRYWAAVPLVVLAQAQLALGARDEATASLDEATALARSGALTWVLGRAGQVRAKLRAGQGELREAESLAHEAIGLTREAGDRLGLVDGLELLARLAADQDSPTEAARLLAAAETQRATLGYARFAIDRATHEAAVAAARKPLGADAFNTAWAEGTRLSAEAAIGYAARGRGERRRPSTGWASLTPTELEVVRLVGQHLSNPEIAGRLFVSRATVKTHLVHIFAKLGINSRSQLAAEAARRGLPLPTSGRS